MDIELLKTFLEVRQTRHFGRAAENLYLTQAAVSARVRQLEDHLGVQLFIRIRNNIQLTPEGERLVPHAEAMLVAWSRARHDVALKLDHTHQINIGTTPGLWHYALQGKLPVLQAAQPGLALRADSHSGEELLRLLLDKTLDMVCLYEAPSVPELECRSLGKLKLVLMSSIPGASLKTTFQRHYVYVDWGSSFAMFHDTKFGDAPPAVLHTNMAYIAESYLREHPASAYLPEALLAQQTDASIAPVKGAPSFSRNVYAVYRRNADRRDVLEEILPVLSLPVP